MAKGVRFGVISDSSQVEEMLSGLQAVTEAVPDSKSPAAKTGRVTQRTIKETFIDVSEEWGRMIMTKLDNYSATMRGYGFMHWTRHLYEGGHVDNMGVPGKRLISYIPVTTGQIALEFEADKDPTPSYSPVSNSTVGYWGNPYPAWEERAQFMFANALEGVRDGKIIKGDRTGENRFRGIGPSQGAPMYIVNKNKGATSDGRQYIFAEKFVFNYAPQKFERDAWLEKHYAFSTDAVMSQLDYTFRKTLTEHMNRVAVAANRNTPVPVVNPRRPFTPQQTAKRFGYNQATINKLANKFVDRFRKNYDIVAGGGRE